MSTFADLYAKLDPDPYKRGKQFEHVCKWFLLNDPEYKALIKRVWLWDEWSGKWGTDAGIDLVAETVTGELWAVQSKAYDAKYSVTKADVDTFLSESSRKEFSYRLLIATTDKLGKTARRTINAQEKPVGKCLLTDLAASDVQWNDNPLNTKPSPPPEPATPRDYQQDAIEAVVAGFDAADRGQLIMACGTGKTLTSLFITEALKAQRVLVLVPSLSLLKQTMLSWRRGNVLPFESRVVCSDDTVGKDPDSHMTMASDLGVPVTTDPADIAAFLRKRGTRVVFSTYQSSPQVAAAQALSRVPGFDLVIADEAHRVAGKVSSDFGTVLDDKAIRSKRRLFMTATPRYFTGRVLKAATEAELDVASMDDHTKFGTVFHRLSFGEAIRRDLLTDYQVAVVGVTDSEYQAWTGTARLLNRDGKQTDARTLAAQIGLAKAMRKYDLHRMISFHSRVSRAKEFAAELPDVINWMPAAQRPTGELWTDYASGEMTAGERHVRLQHLGHLDDGQRGLLANARCLSEGVDVPTLDGVAFIDPRRSEVDIVQAVGRAIRTAKGKTIGTIVIPVFIDTSTDAATALDASDFKPVWNVIKALRAHDDELAECIDSLRREMGRRGGSPKIPDKIHLDLPAAVSADFADAFDVRLVEQTSASWEFWFGLLERYVEENGHARVPYQHSENGMALGKWAQWQRGLNSKGKLSDERRQALEALPLWSWDVKGDTWNENFALLLGYATEHGNVNITLDAVINGVPLGQWAYHQRYQKLLGKLRSDRAERLETLPGWIWEDKNTAAWNEGFARLKAYAEQNGTSAVPRGREVDGYRLGAWCSLQRSRRAGLTADQVERLESLPGWVWDRNESRWDEGYRLITEYAAEHGNTVITATHRYRGYPLGDWAAIQRRDYQSGKLSDERRDRLNAIPGWVWSLEENRWEEFYRRAQEYVEANGDALIAGSFETEDKVRLGAWVNFQRTRYQQGKLEQDRIERLEQLHSWVWNASDAKWDKAFSLVQEWARKHGTCRVPRGTVVDGVNIGDWVPNNRMKFHKLSEDRQRRLESLPDWTDKVHADTWDQRMSMMRRYVDEHGTAAVPRNCVIDGFPLGSWVGSRRQEYKKGKLSTDRVKQLEALPGWVWAPRAAKRAQGC